MTDKGNTFDDLDLVSRIRKFGEDMRIRAQLSGSFMKPVMEQFGPWGVGLSYGSREEIEKLRALDAQERKRLGYPKREDPGKAAPTWQLSATPLAAAELITSEDMGDLGQLCKAVGVPEGKIQTPADLSLPDGRKKYVWQWRDE